MRKTEPIRIGEIVSDFLSSNPRLSAMLLEARAVDAWKEVVSPYIASQTTRVNISRGKLFVYISSSIVRHEVFMRRTELVGAINDLVGQPVITAIYVK